MRLQLFHALLSLGASVAAQSFVPPPSNVEVALSERFPGASISYKQTNLCETTEGVRSYTGFVTMPKDFIPDAGDWDEGETGNMFFWYFEARNDPENAPTSIYLGGGPGYTSFDGSAVFPCYFNPDSNSTTLNEHSWNNNVNLLFVDQPLGVGYSHTSLANGTLNIVTQEFTPLASEADLPELSLPVFQATLDSGGNATVTNTTKAAARTFWRFAQVWFNEFPQKITTNDEISIWAVSYGGLFAPIFTSYILDQNSLIRDGEHELANATTLNMATVGLINAFLDAKSMIKGMVEFAYNNTYDLPAITKDVYDEAMHNITMPDTGALALVDNCRAAVAQGDPDGTGANDEVNGVCLLAMQMLYLWIQGAYETNSPYGVFDITYNRPASHPTEYQTAFFNRDWVQAEFGVPLNFTRGSDRVMEAFLLKTGDIVRYDSSYLSHLLDSGINVAIANGDRDYRCSWLSGEDASLLIPFESADDFASAGYEYITTNSSYDGGLVREHGNLSFSRVFQAGHSAGGYQPETLSVIFERAMFRRDVATGRVDLTASGNYSSEGPADIFHIKNELPDLIENICYVYSPHVTCTEEQLMALANGTAETKDFVVVKPEGTKGERLGGEGSNGTGNNGGDGNGNGSGEGDGGSGSAKLTSGLLISLVPVALFVVL